MGDEAGEEGSHHGVHDRAGYHCRQLELREPMWILPERGEVGIYSLKAASGAGIP